LLATSPPSVASQFKAIAQCRLKQINAAHLPSLSLFAQTKDGLSIPTPALEETLTRARSLYGAGMGFVSLRILTEVIRRTIGIRWRDDDEVADILAIIDSDITQAIQSCKEEFDQSRVLDMSEARDIVKELKSSVGRSMVDVQSWGGEYPFDRASASLDYWKFLFVNSLPW